MPVRVLTIPQWLIHDLPEMDQERLRGFVGQLLRVAEIDSYGYVWLGTLSGDSAGFCLRPEEVEAITSGNSGGHG